MRRSIALALMAPLALAACGAEMNAASQSQMRSACLERFAASISAPLAGVEVNAMGRVSNKDTIGIYVGAAAGTERAYCEVDRSGQIVRFEAVY